MRVADDEPDLGPWAAEPTLDVAGRLVDLARARRADSARTGPLVVAVDGRSAGGKSTAAGRLAAATPEAVVVHTDDIAWHHGFSDGHGLLVDGVREPVARGEAVSFRPPAWVERGREGAVEVPADSTAVFVEGVGSSSATRILGSRPVPEAPAALRPQYACRAGTVFRAGTAHLANLLAEAGVPADPAASVAVLLISATEGAVVMARAQRDLAPFDNGAATLMVSARDLDAAS